MLQFTQDNPWNPSPLKLQAQASDPKPSSPSSSHLPLSIFCLGKTADIMMDVSGCWPSSVQCSLTKHIRIPGHSISHYSQTSTGLAGPSNLHTTGLANHTTPTLGDTQMTWKWQQDGMHSPDTHVCNFSQSHTYAHTQKLTQLMYMQTYTQMHVHAQAYKTIHIYAQA